MSTTTPTVRPASRFARPARAAVRVGLLALLGLALGGCDEWSVISVTQNSAAEPAPAEVDTPAQAATVDSGLR